MKQRRWRTEERYDELRMEGSEDKRKSTQQITSRTAPAKAKWFGLMLSTALLLQTPLLTMSAYAAEPGSSHGSAAFALHQSANAIGPHIGSEVPVNGVLNVQPTVQLVSEEPITAGANLRRYVFTTTRNNTVVSTNVHMIVVDLNNPYVNLDVMTGIQGDIARQQTVRNMARETGAVAGTNGDFFHMGKNLPPIGPVIDDGIWLATPYYSEGWYTFGVSKDRKAVIDYYDFQGTITAPNGKTFPLAGINRAPTYRNGVHSHVDKVFMYTPEWTLDRANDGNTIPNEIYVQDGVIVAMEFGKPLPMEKVPEDGVILRANREAASFFRNNFEIGDPIQIEYDLIPLDAGNSVLGKDLQMLIGGHTLLIDKGQVAAYTANINNVSGTRAAARTGVGISQDGSKVYLFTADNAGDSKGMTLKEMQDFMLMAGIWKGMNLDGGGSTTMVSRPLGYTDVTLTNKIQGGQSERRVANGIGIYTTAPKGELRGFAIQGPRQIFLKERVTYGLRAYDTYYNPLARDEVQVEWKSDPAWGSFEGDVFIPNQIGTTRIQAIANGIQEEYEVEVVGRDHILSLQIDAPSPALAEGQTYSLPVVATTIDGRKKQLPAEAIKWEFIGFEGTMDGDELTVNTVKDESAGAIIASYDGFSTILAASFGSKELWTGFDDIDYPISFVGYPEPVEGWAYILKGLPDKGADDSVLHIRYDFLGFDQEVTKAAYAVFNDDQGVIVPGEPMGMSMELMGDNSANWVRAEVIDATGTMHRIDIAKDIDWTGFKEVTVDLTSYDLQYPIALKRLYVASPELGQEQRAQSGAIAFDNIAFFYRNELPEQEKVRIELTIDQHELIYGEDTMTLDQAPIIVNSTTLIPVYFIEEALGGIVRWHGEERKVTIIKDGHLVELWIDEPDMIVDGQRVTSLAAPIIRNQRTLVPLRIITEAFGWDVAWIGETRTVVLE